MHRHHNSGDRSNVRLGVPAKLELGRLSPLLRVPRKGLAGPSRKALIIIEFPLACRDVVTQPRYTPIVCALSTSV